MGPASATAREPRPGWPPAGLCLLVFVDFCWVLFVFRFFCLGVFFVCRPFLACFLGLLGVFCFLSGRLDEIRRGGGAQGLGSLNPNRVLVSGVREQSAS